MVRFGVDNIAGLTGTPSFQFQYGAIRSLRKEGKVGSTQISIPVWCDSERTKSDH